MKKSLLITLLFILTGNLVAQVNLNKGLVAYYPFDGDVKDKSSFNNHPSIAKVNYATDRFGKTNAACSFNGKNNFIRIPDDASLHFKNGFSISAWVMVKGFYEGPCHGNRIIMKGDADHLDGNYFLTFDDNYSSKGGNCITKQPDKYGQSFYAPHALPGIKNYIVTDRWYLLTYTYDGTTASLYVDCKLQGRGVARNYDFSNNDDLHIGKMDNSQFPYWFNGLLDELRIYNRPLTKDEIFILCDKRPVEQIPELICTGDNVVPAKFNFSISNCTTTSFNLTTSKIKNLKSIQWFFGDGATSAKLSPVHTYKKYGSYKVKAIVISYAGCSDTFSREIQFRELKSDFTYLEQGDPGNIQFKAKNNNASYSWDFGDGKSGQNESFVTHNFNLSGEYMVQMFAKNNTGCMDTVNKKIGIKLPVTITEAPPPTHPVTVSPKLTEVKLEKREKDLIRAIQVENDSVSITLYDNGIIDGDSITLIYNNKILLTHLLLSVKPVTLYLKIDPEKDNNELVMYAENLGSIPPNTALMIIYDGENRYQLNVSSSKSTNGVVSFTLKKRQVTALQQRPAVPSPLPSSY